ncbi:hypothetical protein BG015_002208 [Linnemannia schmuckeri]|uniref:Uncharacterized protein n=1 Tax=Linnemannia schmuckeri TaxID=64567 RepID=A0A9P5RNU0_9FUNG|nr:hypothetical protein BG015_002208 [Linnemannia schmuckeri]
MRIHGSLLDGLDSKPIRKSCTSNYGSALRSSAADMNTPSGSGRKWDWQGDLATPLSGSKFRSNLTDFALWNLQYTSLRTLALPLNRYPKPTTMVQVRSPRNLKTQATLRWRVQESPVTVPVAVEAPKEPCRPLNDPSTSRTGSQKDAKAKKVDAPLSDDPAKSYAEIGKRSLMRSLGWHHPTSSLEIGTLEANVKRVLSEGPRMQEEMIKCIRETFEIAVDVKRMAQRLIEKFLETLQIRMRSAEELRRQDLARNGMKMTEADRQKARHDVVTKDERESLVFLCGRVAPKADGFEQADGDCNSGSSDAVSLDAEDKGDRHFQFFQCPFTYLYTKNLPNRNSKSGKAVETFIHVLVRLELFDIIRDRSDINERLVFTPSILAKALKKKGLLADDSYIALNELMPNKQRIAPLTSQQTFVAFSERDLASFFWQRGVLRQRLVDLALADEDSATITSTADLEEWMGFKEPGFIIKHFVADIDPTGISNRKRRKAGHRGAIKLYSLGRIRCHLQQVEDTKPKDYWSGDYIPTGSVVTDGFRIKVQAFKLEERQDARFKRVPEEDMPLRLTTTVAGVDYYPQETRNVIKTKEDVEKLWPGKDMERIKVLTIDAGQAKAVYQPQFRFRRWLETEKVSRLEGEEESVPDIESRLPPLRGESASVINYIDELERVEIRLKTFYTGDGDRYRRREWDLEKARQEEFKAIVERLLNIVGGSLGRRVADGPDAAPILTGIGLSKISYKIGLTSLDSSLALWAMWWSG